MRVVPSFHCLLKSQLVLRQFLICVLNLRYSKVFLVPFSFFWMVFWIVSYSSLSKFWFNLIWVSSILCVYVIYIYIYMKYICRYEHAYLYINICFYLYMRQSFSVVTLLWEGKLLVRVHRITHKCVLYLWLILSL